MTSQFEDQPTHTTVSGNDGQYSFTGLPPGVYQIAVTGSGMSSFTSLQIQLRAGEVRIVSPATLTISGVATLGDQHSLPPFS